MVQRARVGAGISIALLLLAISTFIALKVAGPSCSIGVNDSPLQLGAAPVLVVLVAFAAIALDVLAIRGGGRAARWGRVGLVCLVGAMVIGWFALSAAADNLFSCG